MKDTAMCKTIIKDLQFIDEQLDLVISILEFEESEKMSDAFNRVFDFALTTSSLALLSFIVAGHLREFFFNYPSQLSETSLNKNFYKNNRLKIIFCKLLNNTIVK